MKYGFIPYETKKAIGVTANQWLYLDIVRGLSIANQEYGFFAHAPNSYYANLLDVSARTIQNYNLALIGKELIEVKENGHRKTTSAFNKLYLQAKQGEKNSFLGVKKFHGGGEKTSSLEVKKFHEGGEKTSSLGVKKFHGGDEKVSPNNNSYNNNDSNREKQNHLSLFNKFIEAYEYKRDLIKAQKAWSFLNEIEKEKSIAAAAEWAAYFKAENIWDTRYHITPASFLNNKKFNEAPPKPVFKRPDQASKPSYSLPKKYSI